MFPASHCPTCGHPLAARDNVPVFSWLLLGGRCRFCAQPISMRYPLIELLTAAAFTLAVLDFGVTWTAAAAAAMAALLIIIAFIDLDHLLVLDATTIAGGAIALAAAIATHRLVAGLEGALVAGGIFGLIFLATRGTGMGFGDVKLAAMLGLFLGWPMALFASVAAFIIGAVLALPVVLARRRGRRDALPFGPFLVIAGLIAVFAPGVISGPYDAYRNLLSDYWLSH